MIIPFVLENPELLTTVGVFDKYGIRYQRDQLHDISPSHIDKYFSIVREYRGYFSEIPDSKLKPEDLVTKQIIMYAADLIGKIEPCADFYFPINHVFGVQNSLPEFLIEQHPITDTYAW